MIVRRERAEDVEAVRAVVVAAFTPKPLGPVEGTLLDELRRDEGWLPRFSLVALDSSEIVGYVVATRATVGGRDALGIGPVAVRPDHQGRGVGSALMHAILAAAEARDEELVALLGEPAFYARFGFRPAAELGVEAPDPTWGHYFRARALTVTPPAGPFVYAAPFAQL